MVLRPTPNDDAPRFEPLEVREPLPAALRNPFAAGPPHPLAARAAAQLCAALERFDPHPGEGKMWGVLVCEAPDGRVGALWAFSGTLGGAWRGLGCAPPLFDAVARAQVETAGEAAISAQVSARALRASAPEAVEDERALAALVQAQQAAVQALAATHASARAARAVARAAGATAEVVAALDAESARHKADRARLLRGHALERAPLEARIASYRAALDAMDTHRQAECAALMSAIFDTYALTNPLGERATLRALFAPNAPPSGAGDCAAPKLLAAALRLGLRPLAMTELWWGPPPPGGGRAHGHHAPACAAKCGPLLPFLMRGWAVEAAAPAAQVGALRVVYQDAHVVVVDKPAGLLSVPGRGPDRQDCVEARLRASLGEGAGFAPRAAHRLDEDTSGLLVAALDAAALVALHRQFADRTVQKRYIACVDGQPSGEAGVVALPLRGDLEDRPRQVVDFVGGKAARTLWRVLARAGGRARVELEPHTGRAHQLRVHAADRRGLGTPIVGDRLYGTPADRLCLHAASLAFRHPVTGAWLAFESPAPF